MANIDIKNSTIYNMQTLYTRPRYTIRCLADPGYYSIILNTEQNGTWIYGYSGFIRCKIRRGVQFYLVIRFEFK